MRISDWSSDVCSSDLRRLPAERLRGNSRKRGGIRPQHRPGSSKFALPGSQHGSAAIRSRVQAPIIPRMANPPNPKFPDASGPVTLTGPAGALELHVDLPDDDVAPLPLVGIVCHPLPTEGGTMHNKVVTMAARALRELGAKIGRAHV